MQRSGLRRQLWTRVLRDWEETVYKFIDEKIRCLKQRQINKRKKHVLKSRVHLDNLNKLHENLCLYTS